METDYFSPLLYVLIFLFGLIFGSFLNSWIWRTWENVRIVAGRSMCIHCGRKLTWYENIPVLSFLYLNGQCRTCKKPISWYYPVVELATAFLFLIVAWQYVDRSLQSWFFIRDLFFVVILLIVFIFDALHKIIIPTIVWLGAIVGLFFNYFFLHFTWQNFVLGILIGGGFFLLQYIISRGRWIGGGDVRMGVMMGIWLGWPSILTALIISYVLGAVIGLGLLVFKKKAWTHEIPFGTFLSVGTFFTLFWGAEIVQWYMGLIGG